MAQFIKCDRLLEKGTEERGRGRGRRKKGKRKRNEELCSRQKYVNDISNFILFDKMIKFEKLF